MNICIVSSQGGHLGQIQILFTESVIGSNSAILVTEKPKTYFEYKPKYFQGKYSTFFFNKDSLGFNPFAYLLRTFQLIRLYKKEKIDLIITNGAQISIPAVIAGRLLRIKTMFIDTVIRVKTPNWSARVCYYLSNLFLVQHENMAKKYGSRAKYWGGIL